MIFFNIFVVLLLGCVCCRMNSKEIPGNKYQNSKAKKIQRLEANFSGYYTPDYRSTERFGGAFLTAKSVFMNEEYIEFIRRTKNIETVILAMMKYTINLMTRDFLDFTVIHLSPSANYLPKPTDENIQTELLIRMLSTVLQFKKLSNGLTGEALLKYRLNTKSRRRMIQTIAVIPYTSAPGTVPPGFNSAHIRTEKFIKLIRLQYLQATVLSVSRYFPRILITTANIDDQQEVKILDLPIWKYVDLSDTVKANGSLSFLPSASLIYLYNKLLNASQARQGSLEQREWGNIEYIYYTEMDQILYARSLAVTMTRLDKINGSAIFVPHRMNAMALPKTFQFQSQWIEASLDSGSTWTPEKLEQINAANLYVLDPLNPQGSCCDDGRYNFGNCGNWWFNCRGYGIQNYTTWLRFGEQGPTVYAGTAHRSKCVYSPYLVKCKLPSTCAPYQNFPVHRWDVCEEMPIRVNIP